MLGDSIRRRRERGDQPDKDRAGGDRPVREGEGGRGQAWLRRKEPRPFPPWARWVGLAVLVVAVSFGLGYLLSTQLLFPRPETAGVGIPVPSLYGMDQATAEDVLRRVGLRLGGVTEMASARVRPGRVVGQEPIPEQQLRPGGEVSVALSVGAPEARVPPVAGLREATARELLEVAGFEVEVRAVPGGPVPRGWVVRTEPPAGTVLRLPAGLTLVINVGPEEPDSPRVDGAATEWP